MKRYRDVDAQHIGAGGVAAHGVDVTAVLGVGQEHVADGDAGQHDDNDRGGGADLAHDGGDGAHGGLTVGTGHAGGNGAAAGVGQAQTGQDEGHGAGGQQIGDLALDDQAHADALNSHGQDDVYQHSQPEVPAVPQQKAHDKVAGYGGQSAGGQIEAAYGQGNGQSHSQNAGNGYGSKDRDNIIRGQERSGSGNGEDHQAENDSQGSGPVPQETGYAEFVFLKRFRVIHCFSDLR